jgi:hypothetical protein
MKEKDVWLAINAIRDKIDTLTNTFDIVSLQNVINFLSIKLITNGKNS